MANGHRRLTEREVQQIFRRAAELHERKGSELAEWGPTTEDVMKIGEDLGMDAGTLRAAIDDVLSGKASQPKGFWREGFAFKSDRTYDIELTDDEWHELLQFCRSKFGRTGSVADVAGAREWDGSQAVLDPIHLSARSKGGSTRVAIKSDLYGAGFVAGITGFFPLLLTALGISQATSLSAPAELLISAGVFGVGAAGWRLLIGWMGSRRRRAIAETEKAIEGLARRISSAPVQRQVEPDQVRQQT
jgi:hypothetical protein